mgnify:CR=1 FL=1
MKFYEVTYVVHSALQEGRLEDIIQSVDSLITTNDGEILYKDNWGRKKLAYMIDKQKYGTYMFLQLKIQDSKNTKPLIAEFEHNTNILRHLLVAIEEEDVMKNNDNTKNEKLATQTSKEKKQDVETDDKENNKDKKTAE